MPVMFCITVVAGGLEGQWCVRLRRQVGHHRVAAHVRGLDVLDALPEIAEVGVGQLPA